MKKLLALVLALVMTLSLCVTSNAAYSDAADVNYDEAVDVMSAIGVFNGADGKFNPKGILTREQAAKIVTYMLLGQKAADALVTIAAPFADVAADRWSAGSIAYCYNEGILAGVGNGMFAPASELTGLAFAKMMLVALGYDAEQEGLTGSQWSINTAKYALTKGLVKGMDEISLSAPMTREQACQMAFNTEKATMVQYDNQSTITAGNVTIKTQSKAEDVPQNDVYPTKLNGTGSTMQFCERYCKDLVRAPSKTDFNAPASKWTYKNTVIGTYAKSADFTFTAATGDKDDTNKENAKALGLTDYKFAGGAVTAYVNGEEATAVLNDTTGMTKLAELTGNGTVVKVYVDSDVPNLITNVVVVKTQLMMVKSINNVAKTVSLKKVDEAGVNVDAVDEDNDNYEALKAMAVDDYVLVTYYKDGGDVVVDSIALPTLVTGEVTKVKTSNATVKGLSIDGTAYSLAATKGNCFVGLNELSVKDNKEAKLYLDTYGYAVYVKDVAASTNYILISDKTASLVDGKIVYTVNGYDMDDEKLTLNVGKVATPVDTGTVHSYTSTTANYADYVLGGEVTDKKTTGEIKSSDVYFDSNDNDYNYASDVKFLFVTLNEDGDQIVSVKKLSGVQKVATVTLAYGIKNATVNKFDTIVVIGEADVASDTSVAYVSKFVGFGPKVDGKQTYYYDLWIDGVKHEGVQAKNDVRGSVFVTYSVENEVYTLKDYTATNKTTSVKAFELSYNKVSLNKYLAFDNTNINYTMADNAQIIDLTDDKCYDSLDDIAAATGKVFKVSAVYNGNSTSSSYKKVSYLYIVDVVNTVTGAAAYSEKTCTTAFASAYIAEGTTVYFKLSKVAKTIAVSYNDGSAKTITPTLVSGADKAKNAVYSFEMPAYAVTISIT